MMNAGTTVFQRGCAKLGIDPVLLCHNREECTGCGWCNYGCRYNRKTSALVTFIPWAEKLGAKILDLCADVRIQTDRGRATGVSFQRGGTRTTVSTDRVIVSAGAIGSSQVLLESGISQRGTVGNGLHVLGGIFVSARVPETLDSFDRIGLTCLRPSPDRDYVTETFFSPPGAFALSLPGWRKTHADRMQSYRSFAQAGTMVATDPVGRVTVRNGLANIKLVFSQRDLNRLEKGVTECARIFLCGGASAIYPGTYKDIEISSESELSKLQGLFTRADNLIIGSAHPQGGNAMAADPQHGVVGEDFCVHGFSNLFVADSSVFPSNIWANCQATVMAVAYVAADCVLEHK
jgi:choline dehydrogenase-like flavoprotein